MLVLPLIMRSFILLLHLILISELLSAQEVYPNCTNPKTIKIPFISNDNEIDEIYYQPEDEYTYWYQIVVESDCVLEYVMSVIQERDDYEMLVYKSLGNRFCNDLVANNVKPISNGREGILNLKKGDLYFFNMVYLNGNGCGHNLSLKIGENNLSIKAVQNDCIEQAIEELILEEIDTVEYVLPEFEVDEKPLKPEYILKGLVVNSKTKENIEATVLIHGYNELKEQQVYSSLESGFFLNSFPEKKIIVSVKKMGYDFFYDTLSTELGSVKIELNPITVGEKIVMKKVYFHPDTYALREESKPALNELLEFMLENKNYSFEIQGHTNGKNRVKKVKEYALLGEEWNFEGTVKKLSKLRAEKIKGFLIKNGVSENRLQTEGYGGDKMIVAKPKNMIEAMKNIRVEVIVLE